jgi:GMP synthase-like glutamine amidotransferase
MNVLSLVHGDDVRTELFAPVIAEAGHRLDEWSFATGTKPPRALETYDAVLVFGGSMHPDQDGAHNWLPEEVNWLGAQLGGPMPILGICLGAQLIARAAGAWVGPLDRPEIGWYEVALTEEGAADSVTSVLPQRFEALQWHSYGHGLPDGAVPLAANGAGLQGFRLGSSVWGVQFHPEVTEPQLERWIVEDLESSEQTRVRDETRQRIGGWNDLGRRLCRSFLAAAERLAR